MPNFDEFDQQQAIYGEQFRKNFPPPEGEDREKLAEIMVKAASLQRQADDIKAQVKATLYLMVGVPGSGKTTYIRDFLPGIIRVCHDDLLKMMTGSWDMQHREAYHTAEDAIVSALLLKGFDVVIDRTLLDTNSRKRFIELANKCLVKTVAIVMTTPLEVAKQWNRNVDRVLLGHFVEEDVYDRLLRKFIPPELKEGLAEIRFAEPENE